MRRSTGSCFHCVGCSSGCTGCFGCFGDIGHAGSIGVRGRIRIVRADRVGGFTLVEVLIAVLVLALGLVGGIGMQLHALRTRHESAQLSRAVLLAADMAERIRANPAQAAAYVGFEYDSMQQPLADGGQGGAGGPGGPDNPGQPGQPGLPGLPGIPGTPDRAGPDAELEALKRQVASQFPTGRVRICRDAAAWQNGRLRWSCSGGAAAPVVVKIGWRGKNPDGTVRTFGELDTSPGIAIAVFTDVVGGAP